MRLRAHFCPLCAGKGNVRLAKGRYKIEEEGEWIDACYTHLKQAYPYFEKERYLLPGCVSPKYFRSS